MSIERLVGGLIRSAVSTPGRRNNGVQRLVRGNAGAIGMGIVGLALGALDHYQNSSAASQGPGADGYAGPDDPQSGSPRSEPPPAPLPRGNFGGPSAVPPPRPPGPPSFSGPPPAPPRAGSTPAPGRPGATSSGESDATLLLRAMVSAAAADGTIDETERAKIFERLAVDGLDAHDQELLEEELRSPLSLDELLREIESVPRSQELRDQVYFVSLVSIRADSEAEKAHLRKLAGSLRVSPDKASGWNELLGLAL